MFKKYTATIELSFNGRDEKLDKIILDHFENKIDDYLRDLDKDEYESAKLKMTCFYRRNEMEDDKYEKLSDGEVLDIIFSKFDIQDEDNATEQLLSKIDTAITYKKYLADMLFYQAVNMKKEDLQDVLFFEEETTDSWTLEQCQIQYVKDQISFFEAGNLDDQVKETWEKIND